MPSSHPSVPHRTRGLTAAFLLFAAASALPATLAAQNPGGAPAGNQRVEVDSIAVEGNRLFQTTPLLGTIGIFPGDTVGYFEVQEAEKRLWGTGSFSDVSVTGRTLPGGSALLTFHVQENPLINSRSIEGLTTLKADDVWDHLGISDGSSYSAELFVEAQRYIQTELADRGIPFAQVEEELTRSPDNPSMAAWVLRVNEGQRVTIAEVRFNGNDSFDDSDLEGILSNQSEGFFWFRQGALKQDELEEDLQTRLPDFYASRGFLDFQVLGDTVIIDPTTGKARLEVDVSEGPQYRVDHLAIEGNRQFTSERLEALYQPGQGGILSSLGIGGSGDGESPVFDRIAFEDATSSVSTLYANSGYPFAQVQPGIERVPPASEDEPPKVALHWVIDEGPPGYVRKVNIVGNDYTHDRVIRQRISLLPGDLFSQDRLIRSYQAISGLGFFESPLPAPDINADPETGDIDVTFQVEERQTGSVNFGTTVGGGTGLSGFIGLDHPNLFGQAKSGSVRWDFGRYQNSFTLQYADPALFDSMLSGSISLYNARDRFFSFNTGQRRVLGVTTQIGIPVPRSLFSRIYVGYSISRTSYNLEGGVSDTSLFGRPSGLLSQLSLGIARNTLDHPLFPTVGSNLRWTTEINGGFLGGDGSFAKHTFDGSWWVPVGQIGGSGLGSAPVRLALGLRARAGAITGDASAFPFERFWVGGVQFGEPLRGYEETTVTPLGWIPRGSTNVQDVQRLGDAFMTISSELAARLSGSISISAFYEAGNVWQSPREMDPSKLLRGAGLGLELVTPFGPFGLDYAYGFDKSPPSWQFHFRMGGQQGL